MTDEQLRRVRENFFALQNSIVQQLEELDRKATFSVERVQRREGGYSEPRVLVDGKRFEKAAVLFTYSVGKKLPSATSARRPDLAGLPFSATAISTIVHPWNPHVPTTHMNLRFFVVHDQHPVWHFGGGFDLTPHIVYPADARLWHEHARAACSNAAEYDSYKRACDEYFFLPHRNEQRGIGGIFFDDLCKPNFDSCLNFSKRVGKEFIAAYVQIVARRANESWTPEEEEWMLVRRGRYAEFNLAVDRGTKYGLQSGRRVESVLASLPPRVRWTYDFRPPRGSKMEQTLNFLYQPLDWLQVVDNSVDK